MPGTDAYAGYCMAAAGFLALAHTLKHGEHIRVTLVLEHCRPEGASGRSSCGRWSSACCSPHCSRSTARGLAYQSWTFNDISTGNDATPLWIPQLAMAFGTVILLVAIVDELLLEWRGERRTGAGRGPHAE